MSATATTVRRGFAHTCPKCGEAGTCKINLDSLDNIQCSSCDEEMTIDDIRQLVAEWTAVLAWLDTAPQLPEEE